MKRIKYVFGSLLGTLALLPTLAFAQAGQFEASRGLAGFLTSLKATMQFIVPILIGLAVIVFLWGVLKFILNASNEEKKGEGKMMMVYGIIGIVVMISVWGLVGFVQQTFGLQTTGTNSGPQLP